MASPVVLLFLLVGLSPSLGGHVREKRTSQPRPRYDVPDFQTLWHRLKKAEGDLLRAYLVYLGRSKDCPHSERLWTGHGHQALAGIPKLVVDPTGPPRHDFGHDLRPQIDPPGPIQDEDQQWIDPGAPRILPTAPPHLWRTLDPNAPQIQPTAPPHRWRTLDPNAVQIQPTAPPHRWRTLDPNAVQIQPTAPPHRWRTLDPNAVQIQPTAPPHRWQTLDPNAPQIQPTAPPHRWWTLDPNAVQIQPTAPSHLWQQGQDPHARHIQPPGPPSTCVGIPGPAGPPGLNGLPGLPGPIGLTRRDVEKIIRERAPDLCARYC